MDYQVTLSPSARRDLADIVRYISLDAPERAIEFGQFLIVKIKSLGQFLEMGKIVPEFEDSIIREIVVHSYRVNHESQKIEVIRFWHGRRGVPKLSV
jgi:plasmid stabilization system protein ParE